MWKKIKKWLKPWPKKVRIEVRDGDCQLLDFNIVYIYNWCDLTLKGEAMAQTAMLEYNCENLDEVYITYEEVD